MTTSPQGNVTVPESAVARAEQLAKAMTAAEADSDIGMDPWTVQDVVDAALRRGFEALEREYVKDSRP